MEEHELNALRLRLRSDACHLHLYSSRVHLVTQDHATLHRRLGYGVMPSTIDYMEEVRGWRRIRINANCACTPSIRRLLTSPPAIGS